MISLIGYGRQATVLSFRFYSLVPWAGRWSDTTGNFYETGGSCITHDGDEYDPVADYTDFPYTHEPLDISLVWAHDSSMSSSMMDNLGPLLAPQPELLSCGEWSVVEGEGSCGAEV